MEEPEMKMVTDWCLHSPAWYINDIDRLLRIMSSSNYWGSIQWNSDGQEGRPPVNHLFTEIPVACYQAGAPLAHLRIECHLFAGEYDGIFPFSPTLPSLRRWTAELGVSCQHLKSFEFGDRWSWDLRHLPQESASVHMDAFLFAMLSGGKLKSIEICMRSYDLGPVVASVAGSWTHLRSLFLVDHHGIGQQDLEAMCRNLAAGAPLHLDLICAQLRAAPGGGSSSRANALDILRKALTGVPGSIRSTCRTFQLNGVEMDEIYVEAMRRKAQQQSVGWGKLMKKAFRGS
ncbi:hypothetical protein PG996_006303 [Apiospora saccharicola]|uniref:Uncharacterized protein n=1 Tax=Apiospora saccharicola TaxID=335842 RepID=A0ABR1VNX7_9PEZI